MPEIQATQDQELIDLKKEIESLENQLAEYISRKASMEKLIQDYNFLFYTKVGDLISEVNRLKVEKLKKEAIKNPDKQKDFSQAQQDYDEFNSQYNDIKSRKTLHLSIEDQKLIKANFRKACRLCHPDSVSDEFKEKAASIFSDLKNAYDCNDLSKVNSIHDLLKNELKFPSRTDKITDKDRLSLLRDNFNNELINIKQEIENIKQSEIYQHITSIGDWDIYIAHIKKQLQLEVERLKSTYSIN